MKNRPLIKFPEVRKANCCYCGELTPEHSLVLFIDKDKKPNCMCKKCEAELYDAFFGGKS